MSSLYSTFVHTCPTPVQTSYFICMYNVGDQAKNQAHESTPMPLSTNYSIKRSGKISHFTNVIPTETNYVDTLIILIQRLNSQNMRNTTRTSNLPGLTNQQINGLSLAKMEVLLWLDGLYQLLDLLLRLISPLWKE